MGTFYQIKTEEVYGFDGEPYETTYAVNFADQYIGDIDMAKFICDKYEIWPECIDENHEVCSIGFCEKDQKWYGWSHRAIYGFGVGSKVEKGHIAYVADNPEELMQDYAEFYRDISEELYQQKLDSCAILEDRSGIRILLEPMKIKMYDTIDGALNSLKNGDDDAEEIELFKDDVRIIKCGRGEWTAETLEDAKEMAIEFANGVR